RASRRPLPLEKVAFCEWAARLRRWRLTTPARASDARPDLDTSPTLSIIRRPHVHLSVRAQDAACRPLRSESRQRKAERATAHGIALPGRGRGEPGKAKTACLRAGDARAVDPW